MPFFGGKETVAALFKKIFVSYFLTPFLSLNELTGTFNTKPICPYVTSATTI
jgi:hypothetical protein